VKRYKNVSGDSGVRGYDPSDSSIDVKFKDKSIYTYNESDIGTKDFQKMQRAAEKGKGLATMISRDPEIRNGYSTRRKGAK